VLSTGRDAYLRNLLGGLDKSLKPEDLCEGDAEILFFTLFFPNPVYFALKVSAGLVVDEPGNPVQNRPECVNGIFDFVRLGLQDFFYDVCLFRT